MSEATVDHTPGTGDDMLERLLERPAGSTRDLVQRIANAIRSGALPEGHRLLNERRIAELAGLSRSTVRNALSRLEQDGLVTRQVGRGTFVADQSKYEAATPVLPALPSPGHLLDFRMVLEPQLAEHLVLRASDETLDEIHAFVMESRNVETWLDTEYADAEFHRRLCCASGNPLLIEASRLMALARNQTAWMHLKERRFNWDRWWRYQHEHEQIIAALRERDEASTRRLIQSHLTGVRERFLL
jgi:DNA-binding FadR family transcriptional regulator